MWDTLWTVFQIASLQYMCIKHVKNKKTDRSTLKADCVKNYKDNNNEKDSMIHYSLISMLFFFST